MTAMTRRSFVGLAAVCAVGAGVGGAGVAFAGEGELLRPPGGQDERALAAACLKCDRCRSACPTGAVAVASVGDGFLRARTPVLDFHKGYCDFCGKCIEVCPTGASYRDEETGIVLVNAEDCIGCESCLTGCPYGVRQLNPKTNTIEKCTLCFQRKNDENWVPACVHNCCCGARTFGDLDDPNSEAAKVVAAAGENAHYLFDPADLHPTTVYILSEKTAKWQEEPVEVTRYEKK